MTEGPRNATVLKRVAWSFPLVLWFIATFFLLGDLGKWNDDWFYVQREPETGAIRSLVLDRPVHFWRPLYRVIVPGLATLLNGREPAHHLICAAVHGLNAWLVWKLLATLGARRLAASLAALLFLVQPAAFEAVFWLCCLPTLLSAAVSLGAMIAAARLAGAGRAWGAACVGGAAAFAAAALNEQPAALLLALPLVCWAAAGRAGVLVTLGAVGTSLGLYVLGHAYMVQRMPAVGGGGLFVGPGLMAGVAAGAAVWAWEWCTSLGSMLRALEHGAAALAEHPALALAAGAVLVAAGVVWVLEQRERGHEPAGVGVGSPGRLVLIGLVMGATAGAPIVLTNYWLNPRVLYAPSVGLALAVAGLGMIPGRRTQAARLRVGRMAAAGAGAGVLGMLALMMVGVQWSFQRRDREDRWELAALSGMVPRPGWGAVFVPVRAELPRHPAWADMYERQFWGVFHSWWSSSWSVRQQYRRGDITAGHGIGGPAWSRPAMTGVLVQGVGRVEWERVIPFTVDEDGRVELIGSVSWVSPSGIQRTVKLRGVEELTEGAGHYSFER